MLYYNTTSTIMRIYSGSAWENVAVSTAGFTTLTGVETLTNKTLTSPKINEDVVVTSTATELNLLDGVSGLVQADLTKLAAIDATAAEIDLLDGLSRGSIIYGNASAATTVLTKGTTAQVLTSDGTDISWSDPASGGTDWQSVVTASTLTAVAGNGYWINTTSNACTITLPASASVGDTIEFSDYARNWGTNAITINTNSLNFQGNTSPNPVYDVNGQSVRIVYSGATQGWIPTVDDNVTMETPQAYDIDFLIVAGGGSASGDLCGGGGAGGFRTSSETSVAAGIVITVTVGDGGTGINDNDFRGTSGSDSSISGSGITNITSTGGGAGGAYAYSNASLRYGLTGGSGGGGGGHDSSGGAGGAGDTPSTSPSQGNNGAAGTGGSPFTGGGGGGAGANASGANGGNGSASSITGSSVTYGGGGGGTGYGVSGTGGSGGGGAGDDSNNADGGDGTVNLGGGGGAAGGGTGVGGNGGKGVVILSVPDANYSSTTTGSPTVVTGVSGKTILTFTGTGSYTT